MDATPLFEDVAFLPTWPGQPTADREGEVIAASLAGKHALLLAHHGLLAAGRTVQEAAFLAVFMERMARQQIAAAAVGGARPIDPVESAPGPRLPAQRPDHEPHLRRLVAARRAAKRLAPMKPLDVWLQRVLGVTAAAVLFVMMMLTAVDVVGRYVFNRPINGGFEVTELMLAVLIYCGLPLVSARREHIVIDTFDPLFSRRFKRGLDIAAEVVCAAAFAGLAVLIFLRGRRIADYGDTTSVLRIPLAPVVYLMAAMIMITALIHLWLVFVPQRERRASHSPESGAGA